MWKYPLDPSYVVSIIEYPLGEGFEHVQYIFVTMREVSKTRVAIIGDPFGAPKLKITLHTALWGGPSRMFLCADHICNSHP